MIPGGKGSRMSLTWDAGAWTYFPSGNVAGHAKKAGYPCAPSAWLLHGMASRQIMKKKVGELGEQSVRPNILDRNVQVVLINPSEKLSAERLGRFCAS